MNNEMVAPQRRGVKHLRAVLFAVLHKPEPGNRLARYANYLLVGLILANLVSVALETVPSIHAQWKQEFWWLEAISTALFAIEYLARLWVCVEQRKLSHPVLGRLRYALQPLAILDLVVVLTYWIALDLRFLRVFRIVRLLKVLQLYEFEAALERLGVSLRKRRQMLIVSVALMFVCVYAASALLYQVEKAHQPTVFTSIPATFWWAVETFTTIGYGDMAPVTPVGKLFAALISVFGIGVFALPTAIVTAAIIESSASHDAVAELDCPACGHRFKAPGGHGHS
ncbi:ion transporter [Pelomonas sp. SE-A7]|uniref:ion transporter n=1 Tax=Pelomonas sp. SE-A7 TaxID=3054953 RepID=UPI00259CF547|nr:ion transporter [Pelomonas sp. SE-A7]MDM4768459.1 ion transporter [Pelomonas sp. SE-A7]